MNIFNNTGITFVNVNSGAVVGIDQLHVIYKEWAERNDCVEVMLHDQLVVMASINDLATISGVGGFEEVMRLVQLKLQELQTGEKPSLLGDFAQMKQRQDFKQNNPLPTVEELDRMQLARAMDINYDYGAHASGETTKPYDRPSDLLLGKVEKDDSSDPES